MLSKREQQVALLVAQGLSNKLIAHQLCITERTIKAHLTAVYAKLNIANRVQLAIFMMQEQK